MNNSQISIDQIICSWLGKRGYPIHWYVTAALYAQEAIQELQFTSMPLLHHKLITRDDANTFTLPQDMSRVVRVGVRSGDRWWPLAVESSLMPFPNTVGRGDMLASEFASDLNIYGANQGWSGSATSGGGFSEDDFSGDDYSNGSGTAAASTSTTESVWDGYYSWGSSYAPYRGISIDERTGMVMIPEAFPYTEIYLTYVGIGDIDNMTNIPLFAQAAIEAYMDYKYAANNSSISRGEAGDWERKWDNQHRHLRARVNQMSIQEIEQAFDKAFYGLPVSINPAIGQ